MPLLLQISLKILKKIKCPLYQLQTNNWKCIFPINVIDSVQKVHFINYSETKWIKNDFYFTAI